MPEETTADLPRPNGLSRRRVVKGAAWSLPVIAATVAVPAHAASGKANIAVTSSCFAGTTALGTQLGPTWVMKETNGVSAATVALTEKLSFTFTSVLTGPLGFIAISGAIPGIVTWITVQSAGAITAIPWYQTNGSQLTVPPINLDPANITSALVPVQNPNGTYAVHYTLTRNVTWNNVAPLSEARYSYPLNLTPPPLPGLNVTQNWTLTSGLADANAADNTGVINTALLAACA